MSQKFNRIPAAARGIQPKIYVHEHAVTSLTSTQSMIFGLLMFSISKYGQSTLSKGTLAKRLGCERKTVQLAFKELINLGWIEERVYNCPAGLATFAGQLLPDNIRTGYASLIGARTKSADTGLLIEVHLKSFENADSEDKLRKKAGMLRMLAFVSGLVAYRTASYATRNNKRARCYYRNKSALANALNITRKTAVKYLKMLSTDAAVPLFNVVREARGLYLDATPHFIESQIQALHQRLKPPRTTQQ